MALTRKQSNNVALGSGAAILSSAGLLNPGTVRLLIRGLSKIANVASSGSSASPPQSGGNRKPNKGRGPRSSGRRGWSTYGSGGQPPTPITVTPQMKRLSGTFTGSVAINNVTAGIANYSLLMSYDSGIGNTMLAFLNSNDTSLLRGFTYFRIRSVTLKLNPTLGTTATGYVGIGYTDSLYTTSAPTALSDITGCPQNATGSTWNPLSLTFRPTNKEAEYTLNNSSLDLNHRAPGIVKIYSSNNAANTTTAFIMDIQMQMDIW